MYCRLALIANEIAGLRSEAMNQSITNFLCILKAADFVEFFGAQSIEDNITSLSIVLQHLHFFPCHFTIRFFSILEEITLQVNAHNSPNGEVNNDQEYAFFILCFQLEKFVPSN